MKETREIGRIAAISITCRSCGKVFAMNRREIIWYSNMGYPLPKRCPECRKKRRKERENVRKQVPIPKTVSDCILLHQMGYTVEVNDGDTITIKRRNRVLTKKYIKE